MRRRKLRWAVAGLAVVLLAAGAFVFWPQPERVTRENCNRIHEGMTPAEVEAILGPPGDYRSGPTDPDLPNPFPWFVSGVLPEPPPAWQGDDGVIYVYPNGEGDPAIVSNEPEKPENVSLALFFEVKRLKQGPLDNLLWRAKRQWRKWFPEKPEVP